MGSQQGLPVVGVLALPDEVIPGHPHIVSGGQVDDLAVNHQDRFVGNHQHKVLDILGVIL